MLEDRRIVFVTSSGKKVNGKVLLCEPGVGIAIVAEDDDKRYLLCVSGPLSPVWDKVAREETDHQTWETAWSFVTSKIIDGADLKIRELDNALGFAIHGGASSSSCPFGG